MRNLLFTISYNGSAYHGFQVQKNALTISEVFQNALERVCKCRDDIKGCSRTDAGVHANMFCLSMKTTCSIPCQGLVRALNTVLPLDVAVTACAEVPEDFHARYDCKGKRYLYKVHNSTVRNPFLQGLTYQYPYPIDVSLLDDLCKDFVGTYDCSALCGAAGSTEDKVRSIFGMGAWREGDMVTFWVEGNGFLYNMVRIMIGTLLDISQNVLAQDSIPTIIHSKDRAKAGRTAPACGLYLDKVFY